MRAELRGVGGDGAVGAGSRRRAARRIRALLACAVGFALPACGTQPPRHLVVVTLDTLRADRLGAYGYRRPTSPHFDRLAERGIRFDDAIAQAIATAPSHASIFTGLNPPVHGLRRVGNHALAPEHRTLAEILRARGFATAAFVGGVPLHSGAGLDQGFDVYDEDFDGRATRRAGETNARVRRWLDVRPDGPFFLWVHYFDPHEPYLAPEAQQRRFAGGVFGPDDLFRGVSAIDPRVRTPPGPVARRMAELYDAEVAYTDAALGELIGMLRSRGILERAVLAVVADHGECLGEHGYYYGHVDVYPVTARVPMLLVHPDGRRAGTDVDATVRAMDLMPTVLSWLGQPVPEDLQARDLTPLIEGDGSGPRFAYTEQYAFFTRAVYSGRWLYRESHNPRDDGAGAGRLFDRSRDRASETDVAGLWPEAVERLRQALDRAKGPDRERPAIRSELPADVRQRLGALGYLE